MLAENTDMIALRAQADITRFYSQIICPTLAALVPEAPPPAGITTDMDTFFEAARIGTHNALCAEARMAFALTLGAAFERHLRLWLVQRLPDERKILQREAGWPNLAARISAIVGTDMAALPIYVDSLEVWLLVSAVRHGDGPSCTALQKAAPHLWGHLTAQRLAEVIDEGAASFSMQVGDDDLSRYAHAVMVFWGYLGATPLGGGGGRRGLYRPVYVAG